MRGQGSKYRKYGSQFRNSWYQMKDRCLNSKVKGFENYGGRGIKVCDRWLEFQNFADDMFESYVKHWEKYTKDNTSIDRIDNDGNYEFSNCRWATYKIQANNKRPPKGYFKGKPFTFKGKTQSLTEWSKELNLSSELLRDRLNYGWSKERAFTSPVDIRKRNNVKTKIKFSDSGGSGRTKNGQFVGVVAYA